MSEEIYEGNSKYKGSFLEKYINFTIAYVCPILLGAFSILIILNKLFGLIDV